MNEDVWTAGCCPTCHGSDGFQTFRSNSPLPPQGNGHHRSKQKTGVLKTGDKDSNGQLTQENKLIDKLATKNRNVKGDAKTYPRRQVGVHGTVVKSMNVG